MRLIAEKLAGKAAVVQVHTDENPLLSTRFGVRGVPVIILVRNGKGVAQFKGAQTAEAVLAWFAKQP